MVTRRGQTNRRTTPFCAIGWTEALGHGEDVCTRAKISKVTTNGGENERVILLTNGLM